LDLGKLRPGIGDWMMPARARKTFRSEGFFNFSGRVRQSEWKEEFLAIKLHSNYFPSFLFFIFGGSNELIRSKHNTVA
jgi:hypothetical protein